MKTQYSLLFVLPLLLTLAILLLFKSIDNASVNPAALPVNAVIGDEGYIAIYGEKPGEDVPDQIRIQAHLQYVEQLLRESPTDYLTAEQKKNRENHLDLLREYHQAGEFPYNDGHSDLRRPTFIADNGTICAVGYLVEQSAGREVAETISERYKYAYITEIEDQVLDKWVDESGFTKNELAMIQPAYEPVVVETKETNRNHVDAPYGLGSAFLAAANTVYLSNQSRDPWLFSSPKTTHWFGLAAGTGSVILGTLNLNNGHTYTEPAGSDQWFGPVYEYKETNHLRTGVSAANIGVGLVNVIRSAYHLLHSAGPEPSAARLDVTHLETGFGPVGEPVPAMQFRWSF